MRSTQLNFATQLLVMLFGIRRGTDLQTTCTGCDVYVGAGFGRPWRNSPDWTQQPRTTSHLCVHVVCALVGRFAVVAMLLKRTPWTAHRVIGACLSFSLTALLL
jgi:hypothetical protein